MTLAFLTGTFPPLLATATHTLVHLHKEKTITTIYYWASFPPWKDLFHLVVLSLFLAEPDSYLTFV